MLYCAEMARRTSNSIVNQISLFLKGYIEAHEPGREINREIALQKVFVNWPELKEIKGFAENVFEPIMDILLGTKILKEAKWKN